MKFTKLKNKLNAIKGEIKRNKAVSYSEWLNTEGLDDNVENRQLYGLYALSIDESNKKADMRLSQIIGRGVFVAVFLVIFIIMCCNSASATGLYWQSNMLDFGYVQDYGMPITNDILLDIPFDYDDAGYGIKYGRTYDPITNEYSTVSIAITDTRNFMDEYAIYQNSDYTSFIVYLWNTYGSNIPELENYLTQIDIELFDLGCSSCYNEYRSIYNTGYGAGSSYGYNRGYATGYDEGEEIGYGNGYDVGYNVGVSDGYDNGYDTGHDYGYDVGYTEGLGESEIAKKSIFAIFDAPVKVLTSLLDFELFGINFLSIFKVILTILLLGAIAKFVLSIAL